MTPITSCPASNLPPYLPGDIQYQSGQGAIFPVPFGVVGVSHRTASLELRGKFALSKDRICAFIRDGIESGLRECIVLSTCNRTEVYFAGGSRECVLNLLAEYSGMSIAGVSQVVYELGCVAAARHLFCVTSGLDSAVLGETEIVAQVKEAWRNSADRGTSGPTLDLLFQRSLEASKRVRTETELCRNATSTATLAIRASGERHPNLTSAKILVLGAGKIAERVLKELARANAREVTILNRTVSHGRAVAHRWGAEFDGLESLDRHLDGSEIIFCTVSSEDPVLSAELLNRYVDRRSQASPPSKNLLIVDLGVPKNVTPGFAAAGVEVISLDQLIEVSAENTELRAEAVDPAMVIIDQEVSRFGPALAERAAAPTIRALRERGDEIRHRNVAWARERLDHLNEKDWRVVEEMARRMMIGLLESPIESLKGHLAAQEHRDLVERLFDLAGGSSDQ